MIFRVTHISNFRSDRKHPWDPFHHRHQSIPLVIDSGMHHGTCVTHGPWCMSGLLTRGGEENVPGIPGACATRNFTYMARGPCHHQLSCINFIWKMVCIFHGSCKKMNLHILVDWWGTMGQTCIFEVAIISARWMLIPFFLQFLVYLYPKYYTSYFHDHPTNRRRRWISLYWI